jgi:hypothetical protein
MRSCGRPPDPALRSEFEEEIRELARIARNFALSDSLRAPGSSTTSPTPADGTTKGRHP